MVWTPQPVASPWTWTWAGAPWTCARPTGSLAVGRQPRGRAGLGADVHEHEPLEQVEEQEADEDERQRRRAARLDRLREHVEEGGAEHHARGEREQQVGAAHAAEERERAAGEGAGEDRAGVEREGLQLVHVSSSPSARMRRASVPRSIPSAAAAAARTPFARASAPAMSGCSTSRMTAS